MTALPRVLADGWQGARAGLAGLLGPGQGAFDAGDSEATLPTCHHVISNFKAFVLDTFHGVSRTRFQGLCDKFAWRYSHRGRGGRSTTLLRRACLSRRAVARDGGRAAAQGAPGGREQGRQGVAPEGRGPRRGGNG